MARAAGARWFARAARSTLLVWCWIAAAACGSSANEHQANPIGAPPAGGSAAPPAAPPPAAQAPASSPSAGSGAAQSAPVAGSSAAPADAGAAQSDAGTPATTPDDASAPQDTGADPGDAAAADAATAAAPIDYGAKGPYEVVIEKNVGSKFRNNVSDDTLFCQSFIGLLGGANPDVDEQLRTYPADMDRGLYTLFRPAQLEEGKKYPVITWGNGTCSHPLLFSELLEHLASHGFLVIATNSRQVAGGVEMRHALDFMIAANDDPSSPLHGKVDTKMLGASGHSQGSGATVTAGADARIVTTVPIQGASASEVTRLQGPTFLIAGELDMLVDPAGVKAAFDAATVPAVYGLSMGQDHLMPGLNPSPILDAVTAWFRFQLSGDEQARAFFYGDACELCSDPRWKLERKL